MARPGTAQRSPRLPLLRLLIGVLVVFGPVPASACTRVLYNRNNGSIIVGRTMVSRPGLEINSFWGPGGCPQLLGTLAVRAGSPIGCELCRFEIMQLDGSYSCCAASSGPNHGKQGLELSVLEGDDSWAHWRRAGPAPLAVLSDGRFETMHVRRQV